MSKSVTWKNIKSDVKVKPIRILWFKEQNSGMRRVWREDWFSDQFLVMNDKEFYDMMSVLSRFGIPVLKKEI